MARQGVDAECGHSRPRNRLWMDFPFRPSQSGATGTHSRAETAACQPQRVASSEAVELTDGGQKRLDLADGEKPVAVFAPWRGSATFARLDAFCRGVVDGLANVLAHGHPIVLVGDGDVGGLTGIHMREELRLDFPVVSIDGLELKEFDYIDIGAILDTSGAVPVVIKSLIFPSTSALGKAGAN